MLITFAEFYLNIMSHGYHKIALTRTPPRPGEAARAQRKASKSPSGHSSHLPRNPMATNTNLYLNLLEEFEQLAQAVDQSSTELLHLASVFNRREKLLLI